MATPDDASQTIKNASGSTSIEDPDRTKASGTCPTGLQEKIERGKKDASGRPDAKDASRQTSSRPDAKDASRQTSGRPDAKDASRQTSSRPDAKDASRQTSSHPDAKDASRQTSGRPDAKDASRQTSTTAQMNSRRVAHVSILPPELLTQIFQYLSLSDRLHFRFVPPLLLIFLAPRVPRAAFAGLF
jgi:hypothetical protein